MAPVDKDQPELNQATATTKLWTSNSSISRQPLTSLEQLLGPSRPRAPLPLTRDDVSTGGYTNRASVIRGPSSHSVDSITTSSTGSSISDDQLDSNISDANTEEELGLLLYKAGPSFISESSISSSTTKSLEPYLEFGQNSVHLSADLSPTDKEYIDSIKNAYLSQRGSNHDAKSMGKPFLDSMKTHSLESTSNYTSSKHCLNSHLLENSSFDQQQCASLVSLCSGDSDSDWWNVTTVKAREHVSRL